MRFLTAKQISEILQVSLPRVYELARQNKIPVIRMGRQVRFEEDMLLQWIKRGDCTQPEAKVISVKN
jgi:excisionase family DNA binding protein